MTDKIKYGQQRLVSERELVERPGKPSQILREIEATLIGELARSVALSDRQFDGWPTVELVAQDPDYFVRAAWTLRAEVRTR